MAQYSIAEALKDFLSKSRLRGNLQAFQMEAAWESIMGKTIANYTDKLQIIDGKLFIYTQVAPLKSELMYQRNAIIERVNEALGSKVINEVIIK